MRTVKKGATSQSVYVDVLDSTSTTGGRKTGLAYNTSSLTAYYVRNQGTATAITLATLAAANTAWSSGGFKEVDSTNMPGIYRLDVPDTAFAAGAGDDVVIVLKGATGMVQASVDVQLVAYDPQDSVRAGLTALPNAAAEAAGGLYTRGTGAGQINQDGNGRVDTNVVNWKGSAAAAMTGDAFARLGAPAGASVSVDVAAIKAVLPAALVSGRIDASVGAMAAAVLTATAIAPDAITDAKVASDVTIASVTGAVGSVTGAVGSVTGNVGGNVTGSVGSVTGLTAANLDVAVSTRLAASSYTAPLDAAGTRSAVGLASANLDTQIDALPTNAELTTAIAGADDATLAAIAALNNVSAAQVKTQADQALTDAGVTTTVTGRIDAAISTRLASGSYTAPDNTGIAAIEAKTNNLPSDPADESLIIAATDAIMGRLGAPAGASMSADIAGLPTASGNAAAVLAATYEGSETVRDHFRLARAALYGKADGLEGTTVHYRDAADTKNRVTATVDPDGNRLAVTTDAS